MLASYARYVAVAKRFNFPNVWHQNAIGLLGVCSGRGSHCLSTQAVLLFSYRKKLHAGSLQCDQMFCANLAKNAKESLLFWRLLVSRPILVKSVGKVTPKSELLMALSKAAQTVTCRGIWSHCNQSERRFTLKTLSLTAKTRFAMQF